MRILVTNDDGITGPGLKIAEEIAAEIAGPDGEVWVVAPAFEQSGVSHCISYLKPMRMAKLAEKRFTVEGSPADCVLVGLHEVLGDLKPDLILSGVNRGHNVAEDTVYSGTVGAAMEAAMQGYKSIAMSQYYTQLGGVTENAFDAARKHGVKVVRDLLEKAPWHDKPYGVFYNVNFPPVSGENVKGVKATNQGTRNNVAFGVEPQIAPNGQQILWLMHNASNVSSALGSDAREAANGFITVTPLRADLTAYSVLETLKSAVEG